jgi:TRAP-type mannitol/chloroaromatic compound transport system substrate-binding protein
MYFAGKDPAFALLGDLIAAYEHSSQLLAFLEYGGGTDLLRELYAGYGVHTIGVITPGKEAFVSKVPVRSVADFAGIKLRAPEGMAQDVFGRIGASPVNLAAAEVYTALERGVIDAADWATFSMNQRMGFHAIAKFPIYPGIHSMPVIDISVNQDRWDALPADIQAILTTAVRDFARDFAQRIELADQDDLAQARAGDIEIIDWSADEREKLRLIAVEVWRDWAERSPMGQRAFEAHMAFLTRIGLIR